ncbi:MAG: Polaribacter phage [Bacteroidota bacterium]
MTGLSRPTLAILNEDYPKVKTIESKEEINGLLNFLITILNIKVSSEEEKVQLDKQMVFIFDLIKTKFGSLTVPEIREAFKMYVAKEFSDIKVFRMIDCIVVGEILVAFMNYRNERLRIYDDKKRNINQLPEKTQSQIKQELTNAIIMRFNEFKALKPITEPCVHIYDELLERGLILGADTPKLSAYYEKKKTQAKSELEMELHKEIACSLSKNRKVLQEALVKVQDRTSHKITVRAKKIVLQEYFTKLIFEKQNIEEILKKQS